MVVQGVFDRKCLMVPVPTGLSILTTSLCILFTITNIPGNVLIILAVVFDPNKNLRTPFNWLVVNLATADLIVGLVTEPMAAYYHIKEAMDIEITKEERITVHMSYFISCTASVLSLSSLAVERYIAVRKPNTYRTSVTNRRVIFTIVGIWFVSLGLPSVYFKVGISKYRFIFSNTSLLVACIIICVTYIFMLRKVKGAPRTPNNGNTRAVPNAPSRQSEHAPSHHSSTVMQNTPTAISSHMLEEKVTKMFIVVLIALLSCYGPSNIMVYMITFCETCGCATLNWLREFHFMFVLVNSSVNFFCYAFQSPRFRAAFRKLFRLKQGTNRDVTRFTNINIAHSNSAFDNTGETNVGETTLNTQLETEL